MGRRESDGRRLIMALVLGYLALFLILPVALVFAQAFEMGWRTCLQVFREPTALSALRLTLLAVGVGEYARASLGHVSSLIAPSRAGAAAPPDRASAHRAAGPLSITALARNRLLAAVSRLHEKEERWAEDPRRLPGALQRAEQERLNAALDEFERILGGRRP